MAESEGIQAIINQAVTAVMVLIDADVVPRPTTNTGSPREPQTETGRTGLREVIVLLECPGKVYRIA